MKKYYKFDGKDSCSPYFELYVEAITSKDEINEDKLFDIVMKDNQGYFCSQCCPEIIEVSEEDIFVQGGVDETIDLDTENV